MIGYILLTIATTALIFLYGFLLGNVVMYVKIKNGMRREYERQVRALDQYMQDVSHDQVGRAMTKYNEDNDDFNDDDNPPQPPRKEQPFTGEEGEEWKTGKKKKFTDADWKDLLDGKDNF